MKKIISYFLALALLISPLRALNISAQSAVLYDPITGEFLFQRGKDDTCGMASTTKIMTALVAIEEYDIGQEVVIKPQWCGIEGSSIYLKPGERLKISDLLYGLMLQSGNDAATALSMIKTGSSADFVSLMNEKALQLGLKSTSFENPSGLDGKNHFSTAGDMAHLTADALKKPFFKQLVSTKNIKIGERYMQNHNKLLWQLEGAIGVKTGFTKKCGRCLVSAVEKNGRTLIAVTLNAPSDWSDHRAMFDYGFSEFNERIVASEGEYCKISVYGGMTTAATVKLAEGISLFARASDKIEMAVLSAPPVYAPVAAGDRYSTLLVKINGNIVAQGELVFAQTIEKLPYKPSFFERLYDIIF